MIQVDVSTGGGSVTFNNAGVVPGTADPEHYVDSVQGLDDTDRDVQVQRLFASSNFVVLSSFTQPVTVTLSGTALGSTHSTALAAIKAMFLAAVLTAPGTLTDGLGHTFSFYTKSFRGSPAGPYASRWQAVLQQHGLEP